MTRRGRQRDPIEAWCNDFYATQNLLSQPSRSRFAGQIDLLRPDVVDFHCVQALWASQVDLVAYLSLRRKSAVKMFRVLPSTASSSRYYGSMYKNVRQESFSSNPCQLIDKAAGMRKVSTPLENCEICNPSPVDHGQDSSNLAESIG